jgi:hypothetical protein
MTRENVKVRPGYEFDHYFPRAKLITITKKKGATVADTLKLIPAVIRETAFHTQKFAHEVIKAETVEQTCKNLWDFVYNHIAYKKDEDGKEQVRSPARTWHDRHNVDPKTGEPMGVDCDCMSLFIGSVLYNLNLPARIVFRITKYSKSYFEHIYPVVVLPSGKEIIIDCVLHQFNKEEPYTEKKDTTMDLEYLNGVTDSSMNKLYDAPDLMGIMDEREALSALGRILKRKAAAGGGGAPAKKPLFKKKAAPAGGSAPAKKGLFKRPAAAGAKKPILKKPIFKKKTAEQKKEKKAKVKKFIGKGLHVTNRINPVTVALRNGVLAGMKLNFLKIAENLRWAYLSPEQAQAKGADMGKYQKLKGVREKLEKIFHGAGGKPENLKKSILTGRGNRDKAVPMNGLGYIPDNVDGLHEEMPLNQLLGQDIYYSENVKGMEGLDGFEGLEGFGELGDLGAATAASVAAASTVLTTIAGLIKSIGSLFPNKTKAATTKPSPSKRATKKASKGGGSSSANNLTNEDGGSESSESGGSEEGGESEEGGAAARGGEEESSGGESSSSEQGEDSSADAENSGGEESGGGAESSEESEAGTNGSENTPAKKESGTSSLKASTLAKAKTFWENNKKWIKPTGVVVGALGLILLTYQVLKSKPKKSTLGLQGLGKKKKRSKPKKNLLSGIKSGKGGKHKRKGQKKKMIALL